MSDVTCREKKKGKGSINFCQPLVKQFQRNENNDDNSVN